MIEIKKPVRRKVRTGRGESLVVELAPEGIYLRERRRRTRYLLPYGVAFVRAAMLAAEEQRRTQKAARAAKRGGKR